MKTNNELLMIVLLVSLLIGFVIGVFVGVTGKRIDTGIDGRLKLGGIELLNVSPKECWHADFSSEFCPVPKDIEIEGNIDSAMSPQQMWFLMSNAGMT